MPKKHGHVTYRLLDGELRQVPTPRQLECLMAFYHFHPKRPTLPEIGERMGGITAEGVRSHVYPLIRTWGYLEHNGERKHRQYKLTKKGLRKCREKVGDWKRQKRKRKIRTHRLRDMWLYHEYMRGAPYWWIIRQQEGLPESWPRLHTVGTIRYCAKRHADRNGLEWVASRTLKWRKERRERMDQR